MEIRDSVMDDQSLEMDNTELEAIIVRKEEVLEDPNSEQLEASSDMKEVLSDKPDHQTPSRCIKNANEEHEKLASISKEKSSCYMVRSIRLYNNYLHVSLVL